MRASLLKAALLILAIAVMAPPARAATGDILGSFATPGPDPKGLAWDGANLWLADKNQKMIFELTTAGTVVSSFSTDPFEDDLKGLTWDGTDLWLAGKQNKSIYQVTTTGTVVSSFSTDPFEDDSGGLTWDGTDLWLAGKQNKSIYQVTTAGTVVSSFSTDPFEDDPRGLTWDGAYLWLAGKQGGMVYQVTTTGTVVSSFATPCSDPWGLTFDGTDFWLACKDGNVVYQLEGPVPPIPDVSIVKTADRATAVPGDTITYTLTYGNNGGGDATNLVITDAVPPSTTVVPGSITDGGTQGGGVITWTLGTLGAGQVNRTVQFSVTVDAGTPAGTIIDNSGTANFEDNGNPQPPVTSNTVTIPVDQVGGVTVEPDQVGFVSKKTGSQVSYTFTITNTGNGSDYFDLSINKPGPQSWPTELLDASGSTLLASDSDGDGNWDFVNPSFDSDADGLPDTGPMAPGAALDVIIRLTVPKKTNKNHFDVTSLVATSSFGPPFASDSATATSFVRSSNLLLTKTDTPDPIFSGDPIDYAMVINNVGNQDEKDVVLTDSIPTNTIYAAGSATASGGLTIEFSVNNGSTWGPEPADPNTVTDIRWTTDKLRKSRTATAGFQVTTLLALPDNTVIVNSATLTSEDFTTVTASASTSVSAAVNFTDSTKTVSQGLASPGDTVTYTIMVENNGVLAGTNVTVTDPLPPQTTYVPGSITGPGADDSGSPTLVWNLGAIAPGSVVGPLTYQAVIDDPVAAGTTSIVNVASIDSIETPTVNTSIATVVLNAAPLFVTSTKTSRDLDLGNLVPGDTIEYEVTVVNTGDMDASGALVTDTLPAGTTYVGGSIAGPGADDSLAPVLSWNVGNLAGNGSSATLTFRATVNAALPVGTVILNQATISSDQTVPYLPPPAIDTVGGGTTGFIVSTTPIVPGATVTLTVSDADLDTNPATIQTFTLTTTNTVTGESEIRTYTETGIATGVFTATVATVFGTVAGTNDDGTFNVQAADTLVTVYSDALTSTGGPGTSTATTVVVSGGVTGTLSSTTPIVPGDTVNFTLTDADLDTDPAVAETPTLTTSNTTTGESETLTYTETGVNTGVFLASVATVYGTVAGTDNDGIVNVQVGDTLLTIYSDAMTATGGPGIAMATTTVISPPNPYRPDTLVKLATEAPAAYLTDDLYESPASTQAKSQGVISGTTSTYTVKLQNDGNLPTDLLITGTATGGGFTVQYLDETSTDRTADVTGAGHIISSLAAGASVEWTLNVTPDGAPAAVTGGTSYPVFLTATSSEDATKVDQILATTTSISARLTLVKSADKATAVPGEEIAYTVLATNGAGLSDATSILVEEPIPADTGFKIGGATFDPGTSTLTAGLTYSNDNGATYTYTPVSGGCTAPAGFDECVTDVRWTMTGNMLADEDFSVGLIVRVK